MVYRRAAAPLDNATALAQLADDLHLTRAQRAIPFRAGSHRSLLDYRMTWTRTALKHMGALRNEGNARWSITPTGASLTESDVKRTFDSRFSALKPSRLDHPA
jgi:hypothetical protein